jgi:hypothetical protein
VPTLRQVMSPFGTKRRADRVKRSLLELKRTSSYFREYALSEETRSPQYGALRTSLGIRQAAVRPQIMSLTSYRASTQRHLEIPVLLKVGLSQKLERDVEDFQERSLATRYGRGGPGGNP